MKKLSEHLSSEQQEEVDSITSKIISEVDEHHASLDARLVRPHAHVVLGGPGSGKSTIIQDIVNRRPEFYRLDKDKAKEYFKEYDPKRPDLVHARSGIVFDRVREHALNKKLPVIIESTGANTGALDNLLNSLRNKGYLVKVHKAVADVDTALKRNQKRDRSIPDHLVRNMYWYIENDPPFSQVLPEERGRVRDTTQPGPRGTTKLDVNYGETLFERRKRSSLQLHVVNLYLARKTYSEQ